MKTDTEIRSILSALLRSELEITADEAKELTQEQLDAFTKAHGTVSSALPYGKDQP